MNENLIFIPAYYEWHLIDATKQNEVLLNWPDPVDDLTTEMDDEGHYYDEPQMVKTKEEVKTACEYFVESLKQCFEDGDEEMIDGNTKAMIDELPDNAIDVMTDALYEYYIKD